jgi:hypothetical protein
MYKSSPLDDEKDFDSSARRNASHAVIAVYFKYEMCIRVTRNTFPLSFDLLSFRQMCDFFNVDRDQMKSKSKEFKEMNR